MSKEKLKPCPFCGKNAFVQKSNGLSGISGVEYYPRCRTKDCVGNQGWVGFDTEAEAIKAWNRRLK